MGREEDLVRVYQRISFAATPPRLSPICTNFKLNFFLWISKLAYLDFQIILFCFVLRHINLISYLMPNQVKENKS